MRRSLLLAGFILSAAVLLGAIAWISRLSVNLETREREARQRAAFEERVRLALWRMDSTVASLLAQENARPAEPIAPVAAAEMPLPHHATRFEIGPTGAVREWADARQGSAPGAAALQRDVLLASLRQGPLASRPEPVPARGEPARPARAMTAAERPEPALPSAATTPAAPRAAAPSAVPKAATVPGAGRRADRTEDPVVREMANQSQLNRVEFEKRAVQNQAFGPPAAGPAPGAEAPPSAEALAATAAVPGSPLPASKLPNSSNAAARGANQPDAKTKSPPSSAPPAAPPPAPRPPPERQQKAAIRRPPKGAPSDSPARALGAVSAIWVGDDLILARRVARGGDEYLQGVRLDGPGTREWLAAQVRDLLPGAALAPLVPGDAADPGRRLALLPLRLDAGPLPVAPARGGSPVRLGLAVAGVAVLLSIGAAGMQLAATLRLARRRADFVSAVTHELRTPLTTFRLYTEMLAGDMVPAAERPAYLGTLREEADRLGHLVDNVLAFARLERGRAEARVEVVELAPLVAEAAAWLARRVERDGLTLATEVPPEAAAARVQVDRVAVDRILQNLADNACKYGRNPADPRLHLTVQLRDRRALLTLRDHGRGLDRGGRRRLFRPFHRSAEQAAGATPGVGLGLALSRRLARGFGGDLRAVDPASPAAAASTGAAFELSLPLAK